MSHVPDPALLQALMEESALRHRHLCPRQVLGIRMGLYGLRLLGLVDDAYQPRYRNERKRLLTIMETDGCGADGVSVATGCYVGRRTLRVLDYGKMAATLIDTKENGRRPPYPPHGRRLIPHPESRQLTRAYAPDARSRWHAYLEAYQVIPDEQLMKTEPVALRQTISEILSRPGVRINCAECGEEIINEREVTVNGRLLCRACAGDRYYERLGG